MCVLRFLSALSVSALLCQNLCLMASRVRKWLSASKNMVKIWRFCRLVLCVIPSITHVCCSSFILIFKAGVCSFSFFRSARYLPPNRMMPKRMPLLSRCTLLLYNAIMLPCHSRSRPVPVSREDSRCSVPACKTWPLPAKPNRLRYTLFLLYRCRQYRLRLRYGGQTVFPTRCCSPYLYPSGL